MVLFQCKACLQEFETEASLLRHISHKEFCKDQYGHEKYEKMRHEARLSSKRKWRQSKLAEDKIDYQKNTYKNKPKGARNDHFYSYVTVSTRQSFVGEAFFKVFQSIYEAKKSQILNNFEEEYLKPKFSDIVESEALDLTFTELYEYQRPFAKKSDIFVDDPELKKNQLDKLVENNLEAALESAYRVHFTARFNEATKDYTDKLKLLLTQNCSKQAENYAFCHFFGKFERTTYLTIEAKAMDTTFETGIDEISDRDVESIQNSSNWDATFDEKIEWRLDEKFSAALNELALSHYDQEIATSLGARIEKMMQKQVEYLSE